METENEGLDTEDGVGHSVEVEQIADIDADNGMPETCVREARKALCIN